MTSFEIRQPDCGDAVGLDGFYWNGGRLELFKNGRRYVIAEPGPTKPYPLAAFQVDPS